MPLRWKLLLRRSFAGTRRIASTSANEIKAFTRRSVNFAARKSLKLPELWPSSPIASVEAPSAWSATDPFFTSDAFSKAQETHREKVETSIVIPVFNKADFTFQCLRSLVNELDFSRTEVIVVNNASTDSTNDLLTRFTHLIRVINNVENKGFVEASNQGAAIARGKYLLFLNNDTIVLPHWLDELVETLDKDASIGAAGSMFLYPDGHIQEAGAIVWRDGHAHHYGWGNFPDDRRFNFARDVDYCSAASLLIRKDLFDQLGGFDELFAPAYYEDIDLCFGVRSLGKRVVYQPASRIIHFEGATAGRDVRVGAKQFQELNREKFLNKWRAVLEGDHFDRNLKNVRRAANRKRGPSIVIFDDRVPTPDKDAGSARMFQILKSLTRTGPTVFVSLKPLSEYERLLWKEGVETANAVDSVRLLKERQFQVAIVSRPEIAEALVPWIRRAGRNIKIIFDMVDAYFVRLHREALVSGDEGLELEARRFEKLELRLAATSDHVWCNSSEDKQSMLERLPRKSITVVPTIHSLHDRGANFDARSGLLFVGNFNHRPNTDAVHYFMREIRPLIIQQLPAINLYVVGANAPPDILAYESESVHILGYVPDIDPLFQESRVCIAPIRFGAGVKGKIGEALSYGLPVVTTSIGAEGFGLTSGEDVLISDEAEQFANDVIRVYQNETLWKRLADNGYRRVAESLTPEVISRTIETDINTLIAEQQI